MADEKKTEVWFTSTSEDHWSIGEEYGSEEAAIAGGPEEHDLDPGDHFYVGRRREVEFHQDYGERVVELMGMAAYDEAGEHAESWLSDVTKAQEKELTAEITKVIDAWLARHDSHEVPEKAAAEEAAP